MSIGKGRKCMFGCCYSPTWVVCCILAELSAVGGVADRWLDNLGADKLLMSPSAVL